MALFISALLSLKQQTKYKANCLFSVINSTIFLIINYSIWHSLFLFGYISSVKFHETIHHVIIITILNQFVCSDFELLLGNKIITGDIAYILTKPCNSFLLLFSEHLGSVLFRFLYFVLPFSLIFYFLFHPIFSFLRLPFVFISLFLSFIMIIAIESIVGLLTMFISQIFGLSMIKNTLINIMAGVTIPFSFYPSFLASIFKKLPFYYALNTPIAIFNSSSLFFYDLFMQILWCLILLIACFCLWNHLIKKITINGG